MPFIKSLFCLRGFDNRSRFLAICSAVYIIFIMLSSAFASNVFLSILLSVLLSLLLGLTSLRRLHDAKLNKKWLFAPSFTFALVAIIIVIFEQNSSYYLLIIPAFCSAILLTYSTRTKQNFILGYYGPVDMTEYQPDTHQNKQAKYRIEPTLINNSSSNTNHPESIETNEQFSQPADEVERNDNDKSSSITQTDIGELIRLKLISNKKAQLVIAVVISLSFIFVTVSWVISYLSTTEEAIITPNEKGINLIPSISRSHPLSMPDNYTLYLSKHKGISINWQADEVTMTSLWSQVSAQGDKSCKEVSFNKGDPIRTLSVHVEKINGANINYFANFSPLDSKALIQALAFRGNFTLCGYNFSLKGSQAALGGNKEYGQWVDY